MKSLHLPIHLRAFLFTACLWLCASAIRADDNGYITRLPSPVDHVDIYRITRPNVRQQVTDYPAIAFRPGDFVTVTAGGCAQTGGHGSTWKRYVDPQGDNTDKYYHGLIGIPGITNGRVRLKDYGLCQEKHIPANTPAAGLHLQLGYEDDDYGDNGYWGREGDNGTGDQCKGLPDAYVIVAIRHGGAFVPNLCEAMENSINPGNFRFTAAWRFHNPTRGSIDDAFDDAFDLSLLDRVNPITYIMRAFGDGMASTGTCEGMCLLADAGQKQWILDNGMSEFLWDRNLDAEVTHQIDVCHWRQLSVYFIEHWLQSLFHDSPAGNAAAIERDLAAHKFGLLSLGHGGGGHVLVPLAVERQPNGQIFIQVYDPNRQAAGPDALHDPNDPPIVINGGNWSYVMAGGETWTQDGGILGTSGLAYIPYEIDDDWNNLNNGLGNALTDLLIVFSADTEVEQITDSTGKSLFLKENNRTVRMDASAKGLGHDVIKLVVHDAGGGAPAPAPAPAPPIRRRFWTHNLTPVSPEENKVSAQMLAEYGPQYQGTREVYLVRNHDLKELNIQCTTRAPGKPVHFLAGSRKEFFEARAEPTDKTHTLHPNFTIHSLSDLSAGMRIEDRQHLAHITTLSVGQIDGTHPALSIEHASAVPTGATPVEWKLGADRAMEVHTTGTASTVEIHTRVLDAKGEMKETGMRRIPTKLLP